MDDGANDNTSLCQLPPAGHHMLLRVLPSVYPRQPDSIHRHLEQLTAMMPQLEGAEQQHLIRLLQLVAEEHPLVSAGRNATIVKQDPGVTCGSRYMFI